MPNVALVKNGYGAISNPILNHFSPLEIPSPFIVVRHQVISSEFEDIRFALPEVKTSAIIISLRSLDTTKTQFQIECHSIVPIFAPFFLPFFIGSNLMKGPLNQSDIFSCQCALADAATEADVDNDDNNDAAFEARPIGSY